MYRRILRLIWNNMGTILLSFGLAIAVWVSAVIADNPNVEGLFPRDVPIETIGLADNLVLMGNLPQTVEIDLRAPSTVWDVLTSDDESVHAVIDLTNLAPGEYQLPVEISVNQSPVRIIRQSPAEVSVVIENLISKERTIRPVVTGEPALGYQRDLISIGDSRVLVSGPESLVNQVSEVQAEMDISGAKESITKETPLIPVDENGQRVAGVTLAPDVVTLFQVITQSSGYRDVAVKVETVGQVASGYRMTNISVFPPTVTVFSSNPELVAEMPGFVSTQPLDLTSASEDIITHLVLDLPDGVNYVSEEQTVEVQVGIAAIESSISLQIPVSMVGLGSGLTAEVSPETVDVIISGPTLVLEQLEAQDIVIVVNLADLGVGTHLVVLQAVTIPERVVIDAIVPESVEVTISMLGTPPAGITPSPTIPPAPTPTPSP